MNLKAILLSDDDLEFLLSYLDEEQDEQVIKLRDSIFHQVYSEDSRYVPSYYP